jgi:hypothetical protein
LKRELALSSIILLVLALALLLSPIVGPYYIPQNSIRPLARTYANTSYNPVEKHHTAYSPDVVNAIMWDYRCIDSFTLALSLAVLALIAYTLIPLKHGGGGRASESLLIESNTTRISSVIVAAATSSMIMHGSILAGDGLSGGLNTLFAIVAVLALASNLHQYIVRFEKPLLYTMIASVIGMVVVATTPYLAGAFNGIYGYVFQNQAKTVSSIEMPRYLIDGLISGSIWFYNILGSLVILSATAIVFGRIYSFILGGGSR